MTQTLNNLFICFLCLLSFPIGLYAQSKVQGKVFDQDGNSLIGVTIYQFNTNNATITDDNGNYNISVSSINDSLVYSYIGCITQKIKIDGRSTLNVTLKNDNKILDQVVIVGYGKTSSKDISSSITSLSDRDFNKGPVSSVPQMINGKAAGVSITQDGYPNGAPNIIIRGTSTLRSGGQSPLYVIDGVPSAGNVSPQDIVSIDILKDASATAIYGSRAANGVIIITTRQERNTNNKYVISNNYVNIEQVSKRYDMMNAYEYRKYLGDNGMTIYPGFEDGVSNNWQDEMMRTAVSQNYYFNIGSSSYHASIDYSKREGIIRTTGQDKIIMRANLETPLLNDKVNVGFTINSMINNQDQLIDANDTYFNMLVYFPNANAKNVDGSYKEDPITNGYFKNPLGLIYENINQSIIKSMFRSVNGI